MTNQDLTKTANSVEIEKIRTYLKTLNLTNNLTTAEETQFIEIAQAFGLNPFKREIYASKYGTSFSIIVGFETYIKRAERSGRLSGWNVRTEGDINPSDPSKSKIKAIITIYRKDWEHPFTHEVYFEEYAQKTREGFLNKFWKEKPLTMIKKVAMAQGFRLCFSDDLGGLPYTSEEIGVFNEFTEVSVPKVETPVSIPTKEEVVIETVKKAEEPKKKKVKEVKDIDKVEVNPIKPEGSDNNKPIEDKLNEEFNAIVDLIDKANSINDLKEIYNNYKSWMSDGELIGRLSIKRKEIEYREEELKRKKDAEISLEAKMSLETSYKTPPNELF